MSVFLTNPHIVQKGCFRTSLNVAFALFSPICPDSIRKYFSRASQIIIWLNFCLTTIIYFTRVTRHRIVILCKVCPLTLILSENCPGVRKKTIDLNVFMRLKNTTPQVQLRFTSLRHRTTERNTPLHHTGSNSQNNKSNCIGIDSSACHQTKQSPQHSTKLDYTPLQLYIEDGHYTAKSNNAYAQVVFRCFWKNLSICFFGRRQLYFRLSSLYVNPRASKKSNGHRQLVRVKD